MAFMTDDHAVGGQLMCGAGTPVMMGVGDSKIRGSAYIEGPIQSGKATSYASVEATLMLSPLGNSDCTTPENTLYVKGNTTQEGDYTHRGNMTQQGNYTQTGDYTQTGKVMHVGDSTHIGCFTVSSRPGCNSQFNGNINTTGWVHSAQEVTSESQMTAPTFYGDLVGDVIGDISGNVTGNVTGNLTGNTTGTHTGNVIGFASGNKAFDIIHPTREGWRLRHVCLEGPSNDVYIRGRVTKNEIKLPEYWKGFVDWRSISVQLTPIGSHQNVIVKRIEEDKIVLQGTGPIDCFYHIFGERGDGEKLIVEYQGQTPADYPGNNTQYSVAGFHYDTRA